MGELIEAYDSALELEDSDPEAALELYTKEFPYVESTDSEDYQMNKIEMWLFAIGYIVGFIIDLAFVSQVHILWAIIIMIIFPFVQGAIVVGIFGGILGWLTRAKKPTKSEEYWVTLLGHIGATRCSIRLGEIEKGHHHALEIKKFGGMVFGNLGEGLLAILDQRFDVAINHFQLAVNTPTPGIYSKYLADAVYRCVLLHPDHETIFQVRM